MSHFTLTHRPTGETFDFELCHSRDHAPDRGPQGYFWACDTLDEQSWGKRFATVAECQQHAMQWVQDTMLVKRMMQEAEKYGLNYQALASIESLSSQPLRVQG